MNENSINTRCPACDTAFNVTKGQLKVADGLVRCGGCLHVFNALPPASDSAKEKHTPEQTTTPLATMAKKIRQETSPEIPQQPSAIQQKPTAHTQQHPIQLSIQLPLPKNDLELNEDALIENRLSRYITNLLIILLIALCATQILWFQKDKWLQEDLLRPAYQALYSLLDKPLPARRAHKQIVNKQLIIQPHEELADAIRISILLENNAPFSQPFPTLQLLFTDVKGRTTAQRTLLAHEYINTQLFPHQLIPSKQPVQIQLDMMAPGHRAVGYQLNLIPY